MPFRNFFETVHRLALQRPQIAAFDLRIPFVLRLEVPFCREVVEETGEPTNHGLHDITGARYDVPQDLLHQG